MQALQLLEGLEVGATSCADSGTIKDLLLKVYQQLEHSSDEPVQQAPATGSSDEHSNCCVRAEYLYCFGSCMHVWLSLVLKLHVSKETGIQ